jgi:glycosyltransferase involved in cell wall biosynthesis/SAM-dependent methyltransferase
MDRITELMDGSYGGQRQRAEARERFDWMLENLPSGPILDIGCSQGFLGFELADHGVASTGLDIDEDAIAFAKQRQDSLTNDVAQHLTFLHQNIMNFAGGKFAHVVIGQVLEHVEDPKAFLDKAGEHLKKGGKLLLSVPYGRWDHDDHHHAFYLNDFRNIIGNGWEAQDVSLIGGRLCAVLTRKTRVSKRDKTDWTKLEYHLFEAKEERHTETSQDWKKRFSKADRTSQKFEAAYRAEKERRIIAEDDIKALKSSKSYALMRQLWRVKRILKRPFEIPARHRQRKQNKFGRLETQALRAGRLTEALAAREEGIKAGASLNPEMLRAQLKLIENGFVDSKAASDNSPYTAKSGHVAYVIHNSLPYSGAGYAVRTHGLVSALGRVGHDIHAVSRLGYPHDRRLAEGDIPAVETIDGVTYHRLIEKELGYGRIPQTDYLNNFIERLETHARQTRPALLHAASNYMNGIAANMVAKRLGIPSVYEVRGLWELTRISRQPEWKGSEAWNLMVRMETQAATQADRVIALTPALKNILISRGVEADKISIVPNAVDKTKFNPGFDQSAWQKPNSANGKKVIGYIGSLLDYEGVDDLITAFGNMGKNSNTVLLIVGNGVLEEDLQMQVAASPRNTDIYMVGRQPFVDIPKWYAACDLLVYPRKPLPVCEAVAPVKVFDAMAAKKPVLSSDVQVLADIINDSGAGQVFTKGDLDSLRDKLLELTNSDLKQYAQAGFDYVQTHSWERSSQHVLETYESLGVTPL